MSRMSGAKAPEALAIHLTDSKGSILASLDLVTERYAGATAEPTLVDSILGSLPSFSLPEDLQPGIYTLVSVLSDKEGAELQSTRISFFIGSQGLGLGALSIYPPSPSKSSPVLLSVGVRGAEAATTAWIRWSYEGRTIAEGPLAEGYDKTVWRTPSLEGAYALSVELYPEEPSADLDVDTPWRQDIKAIVSDNVATDKAEFADEEALVSHLAFDGDFQDTGSRAQAEKPLAFGAPLLDSFPGGFGYSLGETAYVEMPGAVPPSTAGTLKPFSLAWRLYSSASSGSLVSFSSQDGSLLMRAGLDNGHPFVEVAGPEGMQRSTCEATVTPGLSDLAVSLEPVNDRFSVVWSIEGSRRDAPALPARAFSPTDVAKLGGAGSLAGIYDEYALSDDSQGRPPFFRAAALRAWQSGLFIGEGFEGRSLPFGTVVRGTALAAPGRLTLESGSRLEFSKDLPLARPLCVEASYEGNRPGMVIELSGADGIILSVNGSGEIRDADGSLKGLLRPIEAGQLAIIVRATPEGLEVAPEEGLPAASIRLAETPATLKVALCDVSTTSDIRIATFLVRSAPDALSKADGPRAAALR